MGCVLGTRAAGCRKPENGETSEPESAVTGKKMENVPASTASRPEFRLKTGFSTTTEGWPSWLVDVAGNAIKDWKPRRANTFQKLDKIGQGTYSNVYKARDLITGKVVALKKVRFDSFEQGTIKFMAREILVLTRLNHPNVIKLEGLVISRLSTSLYLVFEYMDHDLTGLAVIQGVNFTQPQFFTTEPYACKPSSLPKFPPSKELDIKLKDEEARRRQRGTSGKSHAPDVNRRARARDKGIRAIPAPEANAELQTNLDVYSSSFISVYICFSKLCIYFTATYERTGDVTGSPANCSITRKNTLMRLRVISDAKAKSKSKKFPPPHQDGAVGHLPGTSQNGPAAIAAVGTSFSSSIFSPKSSQSLRNGGTSKSALSRRKRTNEEPQRAPRRFVNALYLPSISWSMYFKISCRSATSG